MNLKRNRIASQAVFWLMWAFFGFSAFSLIIILSTESLSIQLDRVGLENAFESFAVPIRLAVAGFAVLAVWLTLERIAQTTENNQFNNYYRHIDEFFKHLAEDILLNTFSQINNFDKRAVVSTIHKKFYAESYRLFVPQVNSGTRKYFEEFHSDLSQSNFAQPNMSFHDLPMGELEILSSRVEGIARSLAGSVTSSRFESIRRYLTSLKRPEPEIDQEIQRFLLVNTIYLANSLYVNILAFDGDVLAPTLEVGQKYQEYLHLLGQV